ncbi:efflux RND transporter permease subunit, partial [Acinetobacter baumannii]
SQYRRTPEDIGRLYVKNTAGDMVPVSAFAKVEYSSGPDTVDRYNNLPAVKLMGQAAPGYSSGQAIAEVERLVKDLPGDMSYEW